MVRTEIDSMPAELDEVTRRVMQLEIEEAALKKEKDKASRERLENLRKELADLRHRSDSMRAQWEAEKDVIHKVQALREEIEKTRREIEEAQRQYNLNLAAELKHGKLPELERQLAEEEKKLEESKALSGCSAKRSQKRRSRKSFRGGPAFPFRVLWRKRCRNFCAWKKKLKPEWWGRMKQ